MKVSRVTRCQKTDLIAAEKALWDTVVMNRLMFQSTTEEEAIAFANKIVTARRAFFA
jgi:hypothetical protein